MNIRPNRIFCPYSGHPLPKTPTGPTKEVADSACSR